LFTKESTGFYYITTKISKIGTINEFLNSVCLSWYMVDLKKEAYKKAILVLEKCVKPYGFMAANPRYNAIWSRDSMISSLGACRIGSKFKKPFRQSLITLKKYQSSNGQIPNAVGRFNKNKLQIDYASIDSTLWYIIGEFVYRKAYNNSSLLKTHKSALKKALTWLKCQDIGEEGLLVQQPTTDWQDCFPHRYGHTINTQALYYKVLILLGDKKEAQRVKRKVNKNFDEGLWLGNYYAPWKWKSHNKYKEVGEWFDSLGNLLAIIFDLADSEKSEAILSYIEKNKVAIPYPIKVIHPPIRKSSKDWYDYFLDCEANKPYHYSNGGIWPFVGGFYILALIKRRKFKQAEEFLQKLAELNMKKEGAFGEWFDGKTGEPGADGGKKNSRNQAWNAGMYILAYDSVMKKKVLLI